MPTDDLTADEILDILESGHAQEDPEPGEGLRDRKKRRLRQRISNVATALFLAEGFDNVSVTRIAASCEVSEQTVFNYFHTKESMFFDRADATAATIAERVRHRTDEPLGQVVLSSLLGGMPRRPTAGIEERHDIGLFRRFCAVADGSPTLRSAPYLELERFLATVGDALAERVGADARDPGVRLTAVVLAGLVLVRHQATYTHVRTVPSLAALERAVRDDLIRALDLAGPTLAAFDGSAAQHVPAQEQR